MGKMHKMLKTGLDEALEHAQAKRTLRTKEIVLPPPPRQYQARDVKGLRKKLHVSQNVLAVFLNVSPKTVQAWEAGERQPNSPTNRLLEILGSEKKRKRFFDSLSR